MKNIVIAEGEVGRKFGPVPRLHTPLQGEGGELCAWVPEDETEARPLTVFRNGDFVATAEGVYGWDEVSVNITQSADGRDQRGVPWGASETEGGASISTGGGTVTFDGDGAAIDIDGMRYPIDVDALGFDTSEDYTLSWDETTGDATICGTLKSTGKLTLGRYDPESGALSLNECPSSIEVKTPPYHLVYGDNAYIDFSGIEVVTNTGLTIPFDELIFPVTVSDKDKTVTEGVYMSNGAETMVNYQSSTEDNYVTISGGVLYCGLQSDWPMYVFAASTTSFLFECVSVRRGVRYDESDDIVFGTAEYRGVPYYYGIVSWYAPTPTPTIVVFPTHGGSLDALVNTGLGILFGGGGNQQEIPVQWVRPCDGDKLETSFAITVIDTGSAGHGPGYGAGHGED